MIITKHVSKCVLRMNEQLLKASGADALKSRKKLEKTPPLAMGCHPPFDFPCTSVG